MSIDQRLAQDLVTLLVVINPINAALRFLMLVRAHPPEKRGPIARRAVVIAGVVLLGFIIGGQVLLQATGIKMHSFRVAGGLVLLIVGLRMVMDDKGPSSKSPDADAEADVSVYPLAIPVLAGPGSMMTVVLLTDNDKFSVFEQAETAVQLLLVLFVTYLAMRLSELVLRLIGETGVNVVSRVMGLILTAMAVESILTGLRLSFGH